MSGMSGDPSASQRRRSPPQAGYFRMDGGLAALGRAFPALVLAFLFCFDLFIGVILVAGSAALPAGLDDSLGAFARDFRVWCFSGDPATGRVEWFFPFMLFSESILLGGIVLAVWGRDLRDRWLRGGAGGIPGLSLIVFSGLVAALGTGFGMAAVNRPKVTSGLPVFPGSSMRTGIPLPALRLLDQDRRPVVAPDPDGRILLVTAFYAHCLSTCPAVFSQLKSTLSGLTESERSQVSVIAVTMDPDRDTPESLRERAQAQGLDPAYFRLVTGDTAEVAADLDRLGFTRQRDLSSGVINHANLILAVDRQGKIAFRFSLGQLQEAWTLEALRLLLKEPVEGSAGLPDGAVSKSSTLTSGAGVGSGI